MTDHTEIPPALTAELFSGDGIDIPTDRDAKEWTRVAPSSEPGKVYVEEFWAEDFDKGITGGCASIHVHQRARHALAALCLYGQPFGFDATDLRLLNAVAGGIADMVGDTHPEVEALRVVAAKVRALLPPEPENR